MIALHLLLLASAGPALAATLTKVNIPRATTLLCNNPVCGGDILANQEEVWQGNLDSLATQLGIDKNQPDLLNVIKRAGGGWCLNTGPDTGLPAEPVACWVRKP
ncbi:hypothetical protein K491DRAFT_697394 [Lophiostoma macrostomum CBS 122681]|uniref:Uncharacterized protein n=1 Tax=Lophiostoma macrostomum CBS 122681 TaxID=1314788 RepID=A0A6A6SR36_9PLEO|nr:hypothetical protein K491DRAFT_697394 [Lophiostoma macrostomum CBS 122681]